MLEAVHGSAGNRQLFALAELISQMAKVLLELSELINGDGVAAADHNHNLLLLADRSTQRLVQASAVAQGDIDAASWLYDQSFIIGQSPTAHCSLVVAEHNTPNLLPGSHNLVRLVGDFGRTQTSRNGGDASQSDMPALLDTLRQGIRTLGLNGKHSSILPLAPQPLSALHDTIEQASPTNTANDDVRDGRPPTDPRHLRLDLVDQRRMPGPNIRVIERRHVHAHLAPLLGVREHSLPEVRVRLLPAGAVLQDLARARRADLGQHQRLGGHGHDDGRGAGEEARGVHAGEAGVAARGRVEVCLGRGGAVGEGALEVVAYAAGFEGARGLEIFQFEEDSASAI